MYVHIIYNMRKEIHKHLPNANAGPTFENLSHRTLFEWISYLYVRRTQMLPLSLYMRVGNWIEIHSNTHTHEQERYQRIHKYLSKLLSYSTFRADVAYGIRNNVTRLKQKYNRNVCSKYSRGWMYARIIQSMWTIVLDSVVPIQIWEIRPRALCLWTIFLGVMCKVDSNCVNIVTCSIWH